MIDNPQVNFADKPGASASDVQRVWGQPGASASDVKRVWSQPGPNAYIFSGMSRDIEILKNNVEILRSSLDQIQLMINTLNENMVMIWNAPGMPGYSDTKASWDSKNIS